MRQFDPLRGHFHTDLEFDLEVGQGPWDRKSGSTLIQILFRIKYDSFYNY